MPFGFDALVIVLSARHDDIFWIFPPLMAAASLASAAVTYWVGRTAGSAGLPRLVPARHLARIKSRLDTAGSSALAAAAVMPPPFPLTAFLLTCGALDFDRRRFLLVFGATRLVRFGVEALLARHVGEQLLQLIDADLFRTAGVTVVAMTAAALAFAIVLWRRVRPQPA